jgi:hypothetical protein
VACNGGDDGPPLPDLTPFTPEQAERIHAIRDGVAAARELPAADSIEEGTVSRDGWKQYNEDNTDDISDEARKEIDFGNTVWRLMRLIGPDDDLLDLNSDTSGSLVAGLYYFTEDTLVLINNGDGGDLSVANESTIAHEYVHSFQDERYDLEKVQKQAAQDEDDKDTLSELGTTVNCVVEGDASVAADTYMEQEHGLGWQLEAAQLDDDTMESLQSLADIPRILLYYSYFNYDQCPAFVRKVQDERGWEGVDALFSDPPMTTEQVMHPEKYFDKEAALELPDTDLSKTLGKGWEREDVSSYGEFDTYAFFASAGARPQDAARGADGWGGGRREIYRQEGEDTSNALVHIALRWDTPQDFEDFGLALRYVLAWQGWNLNTDAADNWYWWDDNDAGYAIWDEQALQYDLIYSTDATAAGLAKAALQEGIAMAASRTIEP